MEMENIKEGSLVQIVDLGESYTTYIDWVKTNAPLYLTKYKKN